MTNEPLNEAWGEFLGRYKWDYFLTITFRESRHPHHAQSTLSQIGKIIEGLSRGRYFLGSELHFNRTLHVHGLFTPLGRSDTPAARTTANVLWGFFLADFGRSQVRRVQKNEAVSHYCSKYASKELTEWKLRL